MSDAESRANVELVQQWLTNSFGDYVPRWTPTPANADLLLRIMECNTEADQDIGLLTREYVKRAELYNAEAIHLWAVLREVGIGERDLSQEAQNSRQKVASCGEQLGIEELSASSFLSAIVSLDVEDDEMAQILRDAESALSRHERFQRECAVLENVLSQCVARCEADAVGDEAEEEKARQTVSYLDSKRREYEKSIAKLEAQIEAAGYKSSYSHAALKDLKDHMDKLHAEVVPRETQLKRYQDLPADPNKAAVAIQAVKDEMSRIDEEMKAKLAQLE